ncbi:MAG: hypothetical protein AAF685_07980 [Cyanobacteria bacterium P01_C01_bin.89]
MADKKRWVYSPSNYSKPKVPDDEKKMLTQQFERLIEEELKPRYVNPESPRGWTVIEDIFGKWYRNFFHFYRVYQFSEDMRQSTGEMPPRGPIEDRFTRIEYLERDKFNVAYFRHTNQWWTVNRGISLQQVLEEITKNEIFHP